jgi:hypothetical protein
MLVAVLHRPTCLLILLLVAAYGLGHAEAQQKALRPPDQRPRHNDRKLAAAGINAYESKRLKLYTDIDPEIAETLPPLADQLYDALVEYFGPLPPDERKTEFQVTGYLIRDEVLFREQGLLQGLPALHHGKHVANRFWMREQQFDYYRRHLLFHEFTHCYTTFVPGDVPPVWYMEGIAEIFGTHRLNDDGTVEFRILPTKDEDVAGWGRIESVRKDCAEGRGLTVRGVYELPHDAFFKPQAYAWSWAFSHFLDSHPRYGERFRKLGRHLSDGEFGRTFHAEFGKDERDLSTEWSLYQFQVQAGYDARAAAIEFQPAKVLADDAEATIVANRGWQDSGVRVEAGMELEVTASGRFTLADKPRPWVSEPQGISVRYFQGQPLGRLLMCLDTDPSPDSKNAHQARELDAIPVGKSAKFRAPANGRLLFRINDAWDSLDENTGAAAVVIQRMTDATARPAR